MNISLRILPLLFLGFFLASCATNTSTSEVDTNNPYPSIASGSQNTPTTAGSDFSGSGIDPTWSMILSDTGITVTVAESGVTAEYAFDTVQTITGETILVRDQKGEFYGKIEKTSCALEGKTFSYSIVMNFMQFGLKGCAENQ